MSKLLVEWIGVLAYLCLWHQRFYQDLSHLSLAYNIGITHVFHALTFAGSRGRCLEHEAHRPSAQTSPKVPGKC